MADFPPPDVLRRRYEQHMGFNLQDEAAKPLLKPYPNGEGGRRYYQDVAIRAVLEKVARTARSGEPPRALLALATGAGKTFIAVNLLKRIADAGQLKRALFVCDRDELRAQALGAFQNVFSSDAAEVRRSGDGTNNAKNARVHIATYQTLGVDSMDGDASFLTEHYPEDYFSHIVIDECHFKYVRSPISFYQMIGRGTRLDPGSDKLMFRVHDYTGATDLFGEAFITKRLSRN